MPLQYGWTQTGGASVVLSSNTISRPTFTAPGAADVLAFNLIVTDAYGLPGPSNSVVITVVALSPVAGFTAWPTFGVRPLTVTFIDTSIGGVNAWLWNFGDTFTGTLQHPTHIYSATGVYTVALTASGPGGADTLTRTNYVTVTEGVMASVDPTAGGTLVFTDTQGTPTTIHVPSSAVDQAITLVYTPVPTETAPAGFAFAGHAFNLEAYRDATLIPGFAFLQPVTVTISYRDADVAGSDESKLALKYWNGTAWQDAACGDYERHPEENWLSAPICHLSQFALFKPPYRIYLPVTMR